MMRSDPQSRVARAESWYRALLWLYPSAFRRRFSDDLVELFRDLYVEQSLDASVAARIRFWSRMVRDAVAQGTVERRSERRAVRRLPLGAHRVKGPSPMTLLFDDFRHAARALKSRPGFGLVVVLTLALGIGANVAIFTVINAVLLRPLPYADPERVVMLFEVDPRGTDAFVSVPTFLDWRDQITTIERLSAAGTQTANLTGVAEPDRLRAGFVTAEFFDMLGVQPFAGRAFRPGEDAPGQPKTAVLSYATWSRRFGSDPGLVGRSLVLNNEPHQIIGILPARFEFPIDPVDVWMPVSSSTTPVERRDSRRNRSLMVFGRLRADVSPEQAAAELRAVSARLAATYPEAHNWSARFTSFHEVSVRSVHRNLKLLAGATGFVLLIACANIANLLLARASSRHREMAVRAALGASRLRLLRQLLIECLLMSAAGGVLGLLSGTALIDALLALAPNLPRADRVAPDATVVIFTAALSIVTAVVFGVMPAWRTAQADLRIALAETARAGESRASGRLRSTLIVCELALSMVLLIGAGLLVQSLYRVLTVDSGYTADRLLTLEYRLPRNKYENAQQQSAVHSRVLEAISRVPGIESAALAQAAPQSGNGAYVGYWRDGDAVPPPDAEPRAQFNSVTPHFFRAMGIPVIAGRGCTDADTADAPTTAMVNQYLAERLWPGESPLGRRLRSSSINTPITIVGVVGNTRPRLLTMPVTAQIYGCFSQAPGLFATVIARTTGDPLAVARSVQEAIWSVDADQPMWKIRSGEMLIESSVQTQRFVVLLMSSAAGLALLLAGLGTYSVLSFTVQRRAREVGVRLALGATGADVLRLMMSQTAVVTAIGIALGAAAALALSTVLASQLFEVSPRDPLTFATTSLALASVAMMAAWLPARHATKVDPMVTLRLE